MSIDSDVIQKVIAYGVLIPAIVVHEVSHGWAALALGDTTARDRGRLSLNPIRHIDLWGTILLPALMVLAFGFGFGYAKPVPVNPYRFRDYRMGMFLTGIAGPVSNLLLAVGGGILFRLADTTAGVAGGGGLALALLGLTAFYFVLMNLSLLFFNLIPLPPLDGSRVLPLFLSDRAMDAYHRVEQYGFVILFAFLWFSPRLLGFDPIDLYFSVTVDPLLGVLTGAGR